MKDYKLELIDLYLKSSNSPIKDSCSKYLLLEDMYMMSETVVRMYLYIIHLCKPTRKDFDRAQTFRIPLTKGFSKQGYYRAINELIELNVIKKVDPAVYIVNPYYINNFNNKQRESFNSAMQSTDISNRMSNIHKVN